MDPPQGVRASLVGRPRQEPMDGKARMVDKYLPKTAGGPKPQGPRQTPGSIRPECSAADPPLGPRRWSRADTYTNVEIGHC